MKTILAGKFECALIRSVDEVKIPDRNASTHPYYAGLNRKVPKGFFDRCGTFIALSENILVPQVDWGYADEMDLGIKAADTEDREWDDDVRRFVRALIKSRALSQNSWAYISALSLAHYSEQDRHYIEKRIRDYSGQAADHYLNRLFLQIKAAHGADAFVVVSEDDIQILKEVGTFISQRKLPTPFDFPDLTGRVIEPDSFCNGLLNYSPPDIQSVVAVRADPSVRAYGTTVSSLLRETPGPDREQKMLAAMSKAFQSCEHVRKVTEIFEFASWRVKPFHYIPVVGNALGIMEDMKDVALRWAQRSVSEKEWCLLGVRMTDIAVKDYFNRKSNLTPRD